MTTKALAGGGRIVALLGVVALASGTAARAQEFDDANAPPAPRLHDGTVDFSGDGVWSLRWITSMQAQLVGREDIPFLPWTRAMYEYNASNQVAYDPEGFCLPPGGPRSMGTPYPVEIIQHRDRIIIIFEGGAHVWREIHLDGRELPPIEELNPTYFGYSVGHYEDNGNTLVVATQGFNESTWLNFDGTMHTDALKTIERFTRPNRNRLHYEATIIDPEAYTEPWTVAWDIPWLEGAELQEYICQENNKFLLELKDDFGHPFFSDIE
ncbi:MAG: hypothetical protein PVF50_12250 [Gammaproteobacteria bacterium]